MRELAWPCGWCARLEGPAGELVGRRLEGAEPARDPRCDEQRRRERRRGGGRRDGEDLDVVVHVEHDQAAEDHRRQRQPDGEQREAGELQAHGRQAAQRERECDPRGERAQRHDHGEGDHGVKRYPAPKTVSRWRGCEASSSIFVRRRRMWTVTVPVSSALS